MENDTLPVVVGIDGSAAAISAALWAIDEAVERDVPLRLVYATGAPCPSSAPYAANDVAIEYGEAALRGASSAVAATGRAVKVETVIVWGTADEVLRAESQDAAMLCVASVGIGWVAQKVLGSTATALSKDAGCPVAIVRYPPRAEPTAPNGWIVVGVDDRPSTDGIVEHALAEARLRDASVMAVATWSSQLTGIGQAELESRCAVWAQRCSGVHICPTTTCAGLPEFLVEMQDRDIELVVICAADAGQVPSIIGPHHRPLIPYGQCSVLVVH